MSSLFILWQAVISSTDLPSAHRRRHSDTEMSTCYNIKTCLLQ